MKTTEMDFSANDDNDYIRTDRSVQFKRERRKVGKHTNLNFSYLVTNNTLGNSQPNTV